MLKSGSSYEKSWCRARQTLHLEIGGPVCGRTAKAAALQYSENEDLSLN